MLTRELKYQIVGRRVGTQGLLLDIGARDRILQRYLPASLNYLSADMVPGHDLLWNLEEPIPAPDQAYDYVVALDVLEHLEHIHRAFDELIRITQQKLFVTLPNMTHLALRLQFLWTGYLGGKYDLLPEHQGDRHRWLTSYPQMCTFVEHRARAAGCVVTRYDILVGYDRLYKVICRLPLQPALRTYTVLFEISPARTEKCG